jgi:hypothetical protein
VSEWESGGKAAEEEEGRLKSEASWQTRLSVVRLRPGKVEPCLARTSRPHSTYPSPPPNLVKPHIYWRLCCKTWLKPVSSVKSTHFGGLPDSTTQTHRHTDRQSE